MKTQNTIQFLYFFDPLCGWCYASARALAAVAQAYPGALWMMPSGLFADGNSRPVAAMADHAWRNDTRISELTGQRFTEAYRDRVLLKPGGVFDSGPATRALVALGELSPALEPHFMHAAQIARYIDARDTSLPEEVAAVAAAVGHETNFAIDPDDFERRLTDDQDLAVRAQSRIAETQALMAKLPSHGVPQLLVTAGGRGEILHGMPLYADADQVLRTIAEIQMRLTMAA